MDSKSPTPREAVRRWDTWQILAEPYLDTENSQEWKDALAAELKERGITGFSLYWRRAMTVSGLWWNVLWWEWAILGKRDIVLGWTLNLAIISSCVIAWLFGWIPGAITLVVWLILTRPMLSLFFKVLSRKRIRAL